MILSQRARKIRRNQPGVEVFGSLELQKTGLKNFVLRVIGRPCRMLVAEVCSDDRDPTVACLQKSSPS